jgi:hypothetical protein
MIVSTVTCGRLKAEERAGRGRWPPAGVGQRRSRVGKDLRLPVVEGYDLETQGAVAMFAAALDDQLRRLREKVAGLEVRHLEWQERPGRNTIGMLLTHNALVEVFWLCVAPRELSWDGGGKALVQSTLGVEDDGLPLPADGVHPEYLRGFSLERYLDILACARRHAHEVLRAWRDADLDVTYTVGERQVTRGWTLYHVLEHFTAHFGQIGVVMHEMRDAGALESKPA